MEWTNKKPKVPGYYWFQEFPDSIPSIEHVWDSEGCDGLFISDIPVGSILSGARFSGPISQPKEPTSDKFNEFWAVYPSKVGKKKAYQAWKRDKLDAIADQIIECVRTRIEKDPRWQAGYVPNPQTFINGELWEDEITTAPKVMQWPTKNEDWLALGKEHKIYAGMGEGWAQFKERVKRAIGG